MFSNSGFIYISFIYAHSVQVYQVECCACISGNHFDFFSKIVFYFAMLHHSLKIRYLLMKCVSIHISAFYHTSNKESSYHLWCVCFVFVCICAAQHSQVNEHNIEDCTDYMNMYFVTFVLHWSEPTGKINISACVNGIPYINGAREMGVHEWIASVTWMSRIQ